MPVGANRQLRSAKPSVAFRPSQPGLLRRSRPAKEGGGADQREARAEHPPSPPPPLQLESSAHDLRNILSSVRGYAQLLLSMAHEEKIVEYLAIIEAESSRCCELLERMLRRARRSGQAEFAEAPASKSDAARAAERVCSLARGEAALKGVDITWKVEGGPPPAAIAQEDVEQVLLNLVRNGIQATPRGGRVDVRARSCRFEGGAPGGQSAAGSPKHGGAGRKQPGVEIEVSDTGHGILECSRKMIFEPFFSTRDSGEGAGLGLAICSALVGRCGGSIDVEGRERAGATFTVRLPAGEQGS